MRSSNQLSYTITKSPCALHRDYPQRQDDFVMVLVLAALRAVDCTTFGTVPLALTGIYRLHSIRFPIIITPGYVSGAGFHCSC